MSWSAGKFVRFLERNTSNRRHQSQRFAVNENAEENVMKTQSKRAAMSRVAGAGLVIGGAALSAVLLAGAPAQHATDNAQLGNSVWIDTHGVSTVGVTSVDLFPGDTVAGFPGPSIAVTDGNAPGNTVIWFPGGAIVTGSTFVF
jgi:hypothetical protein